jgi:glycosyltransferase involved in cell wall biosynthesis
MSRLLLAGLSPLPFENARMSYGPGIRTWQLAWSLARAGHDVRLLAMRAPGYDHAAAPDREERSGVRIERVSDVAFLDPSRVRRGARDVRPDALVGASLYGSAALVPAADVLPFWADQFGHAMAEAQAKASIEGRNWPVAHTWRLLAPVLRAADRVSVVSERQRYAAIGELGAAGRLTAETCGYEFTAVIPCALVPAAEMPPRPPGRRERTVRGRLVPEDAFVVLWSGGFNVWSDVETLARGLEAAMGREPRLHFVATGGAIPGLDSSTWERFQDRVARSPHRARFHLEGWVPGDRVAGYVEEADLAVLADRPVYEGLLGSKNRVLQWMGAGLPVVYNRLGDLGDLLADRELGLTFAPGDAAGLADRLAWAAAHGEELRRMAERAREVAQRELTFEATTRPLVEWAADPRRAPDAAVRRRIRGPADHAEWRQRLAGLARRLPGVPGSEGLVRLWRRLSRRAS